MRLNLLYKTSNEAKALTMITIAVRLYLVPPFVSFNCLG